MKILITGNAGYIGSHLSKILDRRYHITGLDLKQPIINCNNFIQKNITDKFHKSLEFDTTIHLAAKVNVGESVRYPTLYYETNVFGTLNILQNISTKNFIFASTGAADQRVSPYGISKKAAEEIVTEYCKNNKIDYTIFRFYNVIGADGIAPTNPDGLFYALIKALDTKEFTIYGDDYNTLDGTCIRDYVHVNEICKAIELAIETPSNKIENLGHGKGYSVREIATMFKEVNNSNFKISVGPRREGDIELSILNDVSNYMKSLYSIEELLKIERLIND